MKKKIDAYSIRNIFFINIENQWEETNVCTIIILYTQEHSHVSSIAGKQRSGCIAYLRTCAPLLLSHSLYKHITLVDCERKWCGCTEYVNVFLIDVHPFAPQPDIDTNADYYYIVYSVYCILFTIWCRF